MLTPSEQWTWHYCPNKDRLLLNIDDSVQFTSELTGTMLNQKVVHQPFSIEEAEAFWRIQDVLQVMVSDETARLEYSLHALANRFRQLSAHKSWYFATQRQQDIGAYQLVQLQGKDLITALVIASDLECIECLLLASGESLAGKALAHCSVIRVLRNRAQLLEVDVDLARSA
ncbi:cell division protein ZapC [Alishewanella longhuensis]|uniref:Cell division protein ZapC n=1 Tax=Alishewanella longhuensis TaxID=1091037 RepID=A0ABQ3L2R0_9ALTE|nr:cell division protein ZapC domain-containing protein [Alishewanella longhuensis]GHG77183.1 cell division protein ZapC [Alishewanella longhuensis]